MIPPNDHISENFMRYETLHIMLDKAEKELEQLQQNPVLYNGETDIACLWRFNLYRRQVSKVKTELESLSNRIVALNDKLIAILQSFQIAAHTRMSLRSTEQTTLIFWYDEDRVLHYEEVMKTKKKK